MDWIFVIDFFRLVFMNIFFEEDGVPKDTLLPLLSDPFSRAIDSFFRIIIFKGLGFCSS